MNIIVTDNPNPVDLQAISLGLQVHNAKHMGERAARDSLTFAVFAKDDMDNVVGGIRASAFWNWLNIEVIWVDEDVRGGGVGKRLLAKAEEFAIANGYYAACLETTSFQAREFYAKQGYEIFGELDNFPIGHTMYYMKKMLAGHREH